jgi:hypothetical protein
MICAHTFRCNNLLVSSGRAPIRSLALSACRLPSHYIQISLPWDPLEAVIVLHLLKDRRVARPEALDGVLYQPLGLLPVKVRHSLGIQRVDFCFAALPISSCVTTSPRA